MATWFGSCSIAERPAPAHIGAEYCSATLRRFMDYQTILVRTEGRVGIVTFNRPQALNALNSRKIDALTAAIAAYEANDAVHCIILPGSEKAFAAGADIPEMAAKGFVDVYKEDFVTRNWERVTRARKPVIAAVAG